MANFELIKSSVERIDEKDNLKRIELAGRVCYKSEDKITEDSAKAFCDKIGCVQMMHRETLAMIQQLEVQVPKWISVEERLPENFATVIIWRSDCKNACIGWLIDGRWSVPKGVRVTHWMPLPEPPKEDAHG